MLKWLFGGRKPKEDPQPAPPVEDYGLVIASFADLLDEIRKMPPGSARIFKVLRIPAADDQQAVLRDLLKGGSYSFNWKQNTVTVVLY